MCWAASEFEKMTTVPGSLIWEIVKNNNCFLVKEFGRGTASVQFSKEANNLYNVNSFKHSGIIFLSSIRRFNARLCSIF